MALSASNLTGGGSGSNATSYTTASISPSANALTLLAVVQDISGTPAVPSISGNGLTWVQVATNHFDQAGTQYRLTVFRALGASPSSGVVTIDFGAATQGGCTWSVDQFTGVDTSGTNGSGAIVQSAVSAEPSGTSNTTITVTLSSSVTSNNAPWACAAWEGNESGSAEGTWTALGAGTHSGPAEAVATAWKNASDDNSATFSWATSSLHAAIIVEVKAASGGPTEYTQTASGTLSSTGVLAKQTGHVLSSALVSDGALIKQTQASLSGALSSGGVLSATKVALLNLAGTLTTAGALVKQTAHGAAGTLGGAGALMKQTGHVVTGALGTAGTLVKRATRGLTGVLGSSGAMSATKVALLFLGGALSSAGNLARQTGRTVAGSLSGAGALSRQTARGLFGTLGSAGSLSRQAARGLFGTLGSAGGLTTALNPLSALVRAWLFRLFALDRTFVLAAADRTFVLPAADRMYLVTEDV